MIEDILPAVPTAVVNCVSGQEAVKDMGSNKFRRMSFSQRRCGGKFLSMHRGSQEEVSNQAGCHGWRSHACHNACHMSHIGGASETQLVCWYNQ